VALTGLGTPNQMRRFVKDGTVKTFALWNPADLRYVGAALASGQITGAGREVQGGQAGRVHGRGEGRRRTRTPTMFDSANIDQFKF
jgi:rhamnose transport system substrate-binding protein